MTLEPLLRAAPAIQIRAIAAMAAFVLGAIQLTAPKGTLPHRMLGWIWVTLMALVAAGSFFIHTIREFGPFSVIHLVSLFVLVLLPRAVLAARRGDVGAHRRAMISLYVGALVIAGGFTLYPGRIMHAVVFGG
jgi:uncharacterized membrane protein